MKHLIIGIDFGTSTTVVKWRYEGQSRDYIRTLSDPTDPKMTFIPSFIYHREKPSIGTFFGGEAENKFASPRNQGTPCPDFKLGLKHRLDSNEFKVYEQDIRDFFKFLYHQIYDQILRPGDYDNLTIYVSVPAKWSNDSRNFMEAAFKEAGFENLNNNIHKVDIKIVDEPTAAIQCLLGREAQVLMEQGILRPGVKSNVMLLDMGAGTSDIVMFQLLVTDDGTGHVKLESIKNPHTFPQIDKPYLCGGTEIDSLLKTCLYEKIVPHTGDIKDWDKYCDVRTIKKWKEQILNQSLIHDGVYKGIPSKLEQFLDIRYNLSDFIDSISLSKNTFEEYTSKHWKNLNALINDAVKQYNDKYQVSAKDFDLILLTGGHSTWYCVDNLFNGTGVGVNGEIGKTNGFLKIQENPEQRIIKGNRPSETVAEGLCMQDIGVKIPQTSANNRYIEVRVGDKSSGIVNIVENGESLPIVKTLETEPIVVVNSVSKLHKFEIALNIYEGSVASKENGYTTILRYSGENLLTDLLCLIFRGGERTFSFNVEISAEIDEYQKLNLNGRLLVNGDVKNYFTLDDFQRLSDKDSSENS